MRGLRRPQCAKHITELVISRAQRARIAASRTKKHLSLRVYTRQTTGALTYGSGYFLEGRPEQSDHISASPAKRVGALVQTAEQDVSLLLYSVLPRLPNKNSPKSKNAPGARLFKLPFCPRESLGQTRQTYFHPRGNATLSAATHSAFRAARTNRL